MGPEEGAGGAIPPQAVTPARGSVRSTEAPGPWPIAWWLLLFLAFAAIDLAVYGAALSGPFISDDIGYIVSSPYTRDLTLESVAALFDPFGAANFYTANYAPVHLLLTTIERNCFGDSLVAYHVVNVLVHALNSILLVALLRRSPLPAGLSLAGGLFFLLHPANVEAVAWISQLKTNGALAFSLGALLALRRHPAVATLLFVLALLTKASAAFALPTAAAFLWTGRDRMDARRAGRWLIAWTAAFGVYAIPQFGFFGATGGSGVEGYSDLGTHARTIASLGMRYLLMAAGGYGVSAFQEPAPATSPFDPWWLASVPTAAAILWRATIAARERSDEFAYWVAAACGFGPVSQIFPFLIPFADRYLYFILPGLIGAATFMLVDAYARLGSPKRAAWVAAAAFASVLVGFGSVSATRAKLWTNETLLNLDAAKHYPDGGTAAFMAARSAAQRGDADTTVTFLRKAATRGVDHFLFVDSDPGLAPVRQTPVFQEFLRELALRSIERTQQRTDPTAPELRMAARAHVVRGEYRAAEEELERALALGGPFEPAVRADLAAVRALLRESATQDRTKESEDGGHRAQGP